MVHSNLNQWLCWPTLARNMQKKAFLHSKKMQSNRIKVIFNKYIFINKKIYIFIQPHHNYKNKHKNDQKKKSYSIT